MHQYLKPCVVCPYSRFHSTAAVTLFVIMVITIWMQIAQPLCGLLYSTTYLAESNKHQLTEDKALFWILSVSLVTNVHGGKIHRNFLHFIVLSLFVLLIHKLRVFRTFICAKLYLLKKQLWGQFRISEEGVTPKQNIKSFFGKAMAVCNMLETEQAAIFVFIHSTMSLVECMNTNIR